MKKVLVIKSSLSSKNSVTNEAVNFFLKNYKLNNPNDEIELLDLNENDKISQPLNATTLSTFFDDESDDMIEQLKSADKIIISAGMVNFNIPTSLKSYFDNVLQANKTFKYKYKGNGQSFGLLDSKVKVQLFLAQGSNVNWYPFALFDKYLEGVLNFMGLTDINTIIYDGTKTEEKLSLKPNDIIDKNILIKLATNF